MQKIAVSTVYKRLPAAMRPSTGPGMSTGIDWWTGVITHCISDISGWSGLLTDDWADDYCDTWVDTAMGLFARREKALAVVDIMEEPAIIAAASDLVGTYDTLSQAIDAYLYAALRLIVDAVMGCLLDAGADAVLVDSES